MTRGGAEGGRGVGKARRGRLGQLWGVLVVCVAVAALVWAVRGGPAGRRAAGEGGARAVPATRQMYVTAREAEVKSRPRSAAEPVGRLEHREVVWADSVRGAWTRVRLAAGAGWVRRDLLFDGAPPPCEIASWAFSGTTVAGTLQNYAEETFQDLRLRIIYYNELGQIVNASLVRLPDVPPASAPPDMGRVSFRTTTAAMGTERSVRLVFGRLRPLTVTVDWTLEHETGVWWYSRIEEPKTPTDETSAEMARRVLRELGKADE